MMRMSFKIRTRGVLLLAVPFLIGYLLDQLLGTSLTLD
jgi:hypothetical protein